MSEYAVEMKGITKRFSGVVANEGINLSLKKGEIHALLGENGAGKSTLMNILFGLLKADEGEIFVNGEKVEINDPNDASALHIGMVHQHFKLVDCFTVLENIILGAESVNGVVLDKETARKKVMELSEKYGLQIDPDAETDTITVGMQQRVEILKTLYRDNDILIFDEPTAVLNVTETKELLKIMKNLAAEGKSILFISHKMNEIMSVSDTCSVIRKGRYVGTVATKDTTPEELSAMMVGEKISLDINKPDADPKETVLTVKDLCAAGDVLKNVSLTVRAGEILTIAGIDGNGQNELVSAITGELKAGSGSIELLGEDITHASIRERIDKGIGLIPVDRLRDGCVPQLGLKDNLVLKAYRQGDFFKKGLRNESAIAAYAKRLIEENDVRFHGTMDTSFGNMSGGNQQKAVFGRELDMKPRLLIAVQPVRGVDILATKHIHESLIKARDEGMAIILISLELSEVMSLSDRIVVMFEGKTTGEFDPKKITTEELGLYMTGARDNG